MPLLPRGQKKKRGKITPLYGLTDFKNYTVAVSEFSRHLPDGMRSLRRETASLLSSLYAQAASPEATYFLDKTPRYDLIADKLVTLFPDARIIVLWCNPLASIASQILEWHGGRFVLSPNIEILDTLGLENLRKIVEKHGRSILQVRYEDLVREPHRVMQTIFDYLELTPDPSACANFMNVKLSDRFKDPRWGKKYRSIRTNRINAWTEVFQSPVRRIWASRYLDWLGNERLERMVAANSPF